MVLLAIGDRPGFTRPVVSATRVPSPWRVEGVSAFAVALTSPADSRDVEWSASLPERLSNAREPRIVTFLAGRYCAGQALAAAGAGRDAVVEFGVDREPIWPDGFVGSITHTADFAGAVVTRKNGVIGIGIDTENLLSEAQAQELRQTVAPEYSEINFVGPDADGEEDALLVSCLFSAKESIYKCLHPLVREFFEFSDVSVTKLDRMRGTIQAVLNRPLGVFPRRWPIEVRFVPGADRVHTSTILRAHDLPSVASPSFGNRDESST